MGVYQVAQIVSSLIDFYEWLIIIWCFMSWFPIREGSLAGDIAGAINTLVAPFMNIFRRFIPSMMGIDFSPIIAVLVLNFAQRIVVNLVYSLA